jgi:hypothetical protein
MEDADPRACKLRNQPAEDGQQSSPDMYRIITKLDGLVNITPRIVGIAMHAMADATTTSNDVVNDTAVTADEPANLPSHHGNHDRATEVLQAIHKERGGRISHSQPQSYS